MNTRYTQIVIDAVGCTRAQAWEIEDGIRTCGGFSGLDHLTRDEIVKAAIAVADALDIKITKPVR